MDKTLTNKAKKYFMENYRKSEKERKIPSFVNKIIALGDLRASKVSKYVYDYVKK